MSPTGHSPLRILLVAPALGLHTTPEVRDLTRLHRVTVLGDIVSVRDVMREAGSPYEVIHYAGHSNDKEVELSNGFLDDADLLQITRSSGAKLVFFNSCRAGRLAHYLVGHGVPLAAHTNVDLEDADAWKFPLAFYSAVARLGNGSAQAYVRAFVEANDGEGHYGLAIAPELAASWAALSAAGIRDAVAHQGLTRRQWVTFAMVGVLVLWLLILSIWPLFR